MSISNVIEVARPVSYFPNRANVHFFRLHRDLLAVRDLSEGPNPPYALFVPQTAIVPNARAFEFKRYGGIGCYERLVAIMRGAAAKMNDHHQTGAFESTFGVLRVVAPPARDTAGVRTVGWVFVLWDPRALDVRVGADGAAAGAAAAVAAAEAAAAGDDAGAGGRRGRKPAPTPALRIALHAWLAPLLTRTCRDRVVELDVCYSMGRNVNAHRILLESSQSQIGADIHSIMRDHSGDLIPPRRAGAPINSLRDVLSIAFAQRACDLYYRRFVADLGRQAPEPPELFMTLALDGAPPAVVPRRLENFFVYTDALLRDDVFSTTYMPHVLPPLVLLRDAVDGEVARSGDPDRQRAFARICDTRGAGSPGNMQLSGFRDMLESQYKRARAVLDELGEHDSDDTRAALAAEMARARTVIATALQLTTRERLVGRAVHYLALPGRENDVLVPGSGAQLDVFLDDKVGASAWRAFADLYDRPLRFSPNRRVVATFGGTPRLARTALRYHYSNQFASQLEFEGRLLDELGVRPIGAFVGRPAADGRPAKVVSTSLVAWFVAMCTRSIGRTSQLGAAFFAYTALLTGFFSKSERAVASTIFLMLGPPGSGKSTVWVSVCDSALEPALNVSSTTNAVERMASDHANTVIGYDEDMRRFGVTAERSSKAEVGIFPDYNIAPTPEEEPIRQRVGLYKYVAQRGTRSGAYAVVESTVYNPKVIFGMGNSWEICVSPPMLQRAIMFYAIGQQEASAYVAGATVNVARMCENQRRRNAAEGVAAAPRRKRAFNVDIDAVADRLAGVRRVQLPSLHATVASFDTMMHGLGVPQPTMDLAMMVYWCLHNYEMRFGHLLYSEIRLSNHFANITQGYLGVEAWSIVIGYGIGAPAPDHPPNMEQGVALAPFMYARFSTAMLALSVMRPAGCALKRRVLLGVMLCLVNRHRAILDANYAAPVAPGLRYRPSAGEDEGVMVDPELGSGEMAAEAADGEPNCMRVDPLVLLQRLLDQNEVRTSGMAGGIAVTAAPHPLRLPMVRASSDGALGAAGAAGGGLFGAAAAAANAASGGAPVGVAFDIGGASGPAETANALHALAKEIVDMKLVRGSNGVTKKLVYSILALYARENDANSALLGVYNGVVFVSARLFLMMEAPDAAAALSLYLPPGAAPIPYVELGDRPGSLSHGLQARVLHPASNERRRRFQAMAKLVARACQADEDDCDGDDCDDLLAAGCLSAPIASKGARPTLHHLGMVDEAEEAAAHLDLCFPDAPDEVLEMHIALPDRLAEAIVCAERLRSAVTLLDATDPGSYDATTQLALLMEVAVAYFTTLASSAGGLLYEVTGTAVLALLRRFGLRTALVASPDVTRAATLIARAVHVEVARLNEERPLEARWRAEQAEPELGSRDMWEREHGEFIASLRRRGAGGQPNRSPAAARVRARRGDDFDDDEDGDGDGDGDGDDDSDVDADLAQRVRKSINFEAGREFG